MQVCDHICPLCVFIIYKCSIHFLNFLKGLGVDIQGFHLRHMEDNIQSLSQNEPLQDDGRASWLWGPDRLVWIHFVIMTAHFCLNEKVVL